jgi:predicted lipoprotein with Yx(FWY)xxD motif
MRRPRRVLTELGLSALAVAGGVALITTGSTTAAPASSDTHAATHSAARETGGNGASSTTRTVGARTATVRTATATVGGISETILVTQGGLPLYTYGPDTASASMVNGELAALWPPLTANSLNVHGASGKVTIVTTSNGRQVTYNRHFLYTFVEDRPGTVTGQGVQNFMVATPSIPSIGTSRHPAGSSPRTATSGSLPGY